MPVNIEIKAKCNDFAGVLALVKQSSGAVRVEMDQEDTFFNVPRGKLKMRCDKQGHCELIYYRRSIADGIMTSNYYRQPMKTPDLQRKNLLEQYGESCTVRKHRIAFIAGNVRIHLDEVVGLGRFVEVEVLAEGVDGRNNARQLAKRLIGLLGLSRSDLITEAYEDLLAHRQRSKESEEAIKVIRGYR